MALGFPHPDFLLGLLTSNQVSEWEAYDGLEPIGGFREDFRIAQLCYLLIEITQSAFGGKRKRKVSISDFMPWGPESKEVHKKKQTPEEMKRILLGMVQSMKREKK